MTTYTYQKVKINGANGWIVTRWINNIHTGKAFVRTKKDADNAFEGGEA